MAAPLDEEAVGDDADDAAKGAAVTENSLPECRELVSTFIVLAVAKFLCEFWVGKEAADEDGVVAYELVSLEYSRSCL